MIDIITDTMDTMDTRVRKFFTDARKGKSEEIEKEYETIHYCYKQALDDADEKVSMASQIYDLVSFFFYQLIFTIFKKFHVFYTNTIV